MTRTDMINPPGILEGDCVPHELEHPMEGNDHPLIRARQTEVGRN
jgi:hypothetical protein